VQPVFQLLHHFTRTSISRSASPVVAGFALLLSAHAALSATVTTDETDYPPGGTVYITGNGFAPGETVELQVLHVDGADNDTSPAHDPWQVTADVDGNFESTWLVPLDEDELGATLELTAVGLTSGLIAQTQFTDAVNVQILASDCTTAPPSLFACNATVCAKATGLGGPGNQTYQIQWFDASSVLQHSSANSTTGNLEDTYAPNSSGAWTVKVIKVLDSSVQATATFTVGACNNSPTCNAGGPYSSTCRTASINGATASDPDAGDMLTYSWTSSNPNVTFSPANELSTTATLGNAVNPCNQTVTLTLTVNDGHGGICTSTATLTFDDTIKPIIYGVGGRIIAQCNAVPNFDTPTVSDNCDPAPDLDHGDDEITPGTCQYNYTITRTWTATDACGNVKTARQSITVIDTEAPTLQNCPQNATVECNAVPPPATVTAIDTCDPSPTVTLSEISTQDPDPTKCAHYNYTITRTWTAEDACGNMAVPPCTQVITVQDTTKPGSNACAPGQMAQANSDCQAAVPDFTAGTTATDNCTPSASLTKTQSPTAGTLVGLGATTVTVTVTDACGNSSTCTTTFTVVNDPPVIGSVVGPIAPVAKGSPVTVTVNFTDIQTQTHTVTFSWDDGPIPTTTYVNTLAGVGSASSSCPYAGAGIYNVTVTVSDCNSSASATTGYIVIYDPNGGFVTGGGWLMSPPTAYVADPSLTGKANFGFVSKYQKGTTIPTGETEFQFQLANLNFHSTAYQWLVVSGPKAQHKGTGTINNAGNYGFLLTATDGQISGAGGIDKFRIKIWNIATALVVYDNVPTASDDIDAANPQNISGGSIVIHK
jgi:hypothetical protein